MKNVQRMDDLSPEMQKVITGVDYETPERRVTRTLSKGTHAYMLREYMDEWKTPLLQDTLSSLVEYLSHANPQSPEEALELTNVMNMAHFMLIRQGKEQIDLGIRLRATPLGIQHMTTGNALITLGLKTVVK